MFARCLMAAALLGGAVLLAAGCAPRDAQPGTAEAQLAAAQLFCQPSPNMPLEGRASPFDSVTFQVGATAAKVCYGRPSARGRTMIGGSAVPFGRLWRTGANEPTTIHLTGPAAIAGVPVAAGSYSLYTIPTEAEWTIIVNRSTTQWGHESQYTAEIEAQEAGRGTVRSQQIDDHVETFTIRPVPGGPGAVDLVLEWERTRVAVPIVADR